MTEASPAQMPPRPDGDLRAAWLCWRWLAAPDPSRRAEMLQRELKIEPGRARQLVEYFESGGAP